MAKDFEKVSFKQWMRDIPLEVDIDQWSNLYPEIQIPERKTKKSSGYEDFYRLLASFYFLKFL
jgi:hypothetical protein